MHSHTAASMPMGLTSGAHALVKYPGLIFHVAALLWWSFGAVRRCKPNSRPLGGLLNDRADQSPLRRFPASLKSAASHADALGLIHHSIGGGPICIAPPRQAPSKQ